MTVKTYTARLDRHVSMTISGIPPLDDHRVLQRQGCTSAGPVLLQRVILLSKKQTKSINIQPECSNPIINRSKNAEATGFINGKMYNVLAEYF